MQSSGSSVTEFQSRVYRALQSIPRGSVTTYGRLAERLQSSPRAVGQALRCNPFAPRVPCHRVVRSDGKIGGFAGKRSGPRIQEKIRLLDREGVTVRDGMIVGFEDILL